MQFDCRGLALTTSSPEAARNVDQAVKAFLDYGTTAGARVKDALEQDPAFVLALCFRGYFFLMLENKALLPRVKQTLDEITPHLGATTAREQHHVKALEAWAAGDIMRACLHWEQILTDAPRDLMALKLHHTMTFYTGRSRVMRSVVSGVLGEWDDSVPEYGCVQGMYAYALEECGAYDEAERWGREAVERNPGDLWAIHSVAHVLEMQGRSAEGTKWLNFTPEQWAKKNPFKAHLWWHAALFFLAQGDIDRALILYDNELRSVNSENYVDVSNQAALLKRIEMNGVDVGDRWQALAEHSEKRIHDHMLPFRDAHFCLALAANGNFEAAQRHIESMASFAAQESGWRADATRDVLIPLCEGMIAHEAGNHDKAIDRMWPIRHGIVSIGGSHAQRDLLRRFSATRPRTAAALPWPAACCRSGCWPAAPRSGTGRPTPRCCPRWARPNTPRRHASRASARPRPAHEPTGIFQEIAMIASRLAAECRGVAERASEGATPSRRRSALRPVFPDPACATDAA